MLEFFRALIAKAPPPRVVDLTAHNGPAYVIGDIHGRLDLLKGLEQKIIADAKTQTQDSLIICIGDMIDRGPDSYGVLAHVMAPPPAGIRRICLMGNHEAMMLDFLAHPRRARAWLDFGGQETLASYGALASEVRRAMRKPRQMGVLLDRIIPDSHKQFLSALPHMIVLKDFMLAHAGGNPVRPLARQTVQDILWGVEGFAKTPPVFDKTIVHGHFAQDHATQAHGKVAVDTGAYASGMLTAAKLGPEKPIKFITFMNP